MPIRKPKLERLNNRLKRSTNRADAAIERYKKSAETISEGGKHGPHERLERRARRTQERVNKVKGKIDSMLAPSNNATAKPKNSKGGKTPNNFGFPKQSTRNKIRSKAKNVIFKLVDVNPLFPKTNQGKLKRVFKK